MNRSRQIAIDTYRPTHHYSRDWGIGRGPSTPPSSAKMGRPYYCCNSTPSLHEPDYDRLRRTDHHVTDCVPSYTDYIRSKSRG